jgi:hypothetical protein
MAYPAGLTLITVTGQVAGVAEGESAYVTFLQPVWLQGPAAGAVLAANGQVAHCDVDGEFTIELAATDDPEWAPVDWSYSVTIYRNGAVTRGTLQLPYDGGPVDLADAFQPDETPVPGQSYALLPQLTALDERVEALEEAPGGTAPSWDSVTGKPATFPPSPHNQAISTITGLQAALDGLATDVEVGALAADVSALDGRVTALEEAPGGGGSALVVRRGTVTSGNLTLAAAGGWVAVAGGPQLVLPAAVGDYVEFALTSMLGSFSTNFADLAVLSGASLVRYLSTGGASPASEGAPAFYGDQTFDRVSPVFEFEVEAGDLSGGTVTVVFATQGAGGGTIYASTDYPLRWRALNHGPCDVA